MRRSPLRAVLVEFGLILLVVAGVAAARHWLVGTLDVASRTAFPQLLPGDVLLVERWRRPPRRGDLLLVQGRGIRRVVGLPGERIGWRDGRLLLDGRPSPRWRVADQLVPLSAVPRCARPERQPDGTDACRRPRFRQMLPKGEWLDLPAGVTGPAITTLPAERLLALDLSASPRVELVATDAVSGRLGPIVFSRDRSARLDAPATWLHAVRWKRIGTRF
jgi:signal peptidase I